MQHRNVAKHVVLTMGNAASSNIGLTQILCDKRLKSQFQKFLQKEFSEENLDFCLDVEKFSKTIDPRKQVLLAYIIVKKYIGKNAPFPINLDASIESDIRFRSKFDFDATLFNDAASHVRLNLEHGAVRRFVLTVTPPPPRSPFTMRSPLKICIASPKLRR